MSRLQNRFAELKAENRAALVTFITAGDPAPRFDQQARQREQEAEHREDHGSDQGGGRQDHDEGGGHHRSASFDASVRGCPAAVLPVLAALCYTSFALLTRGVGRRRNSVQIGSASDVPISRPRTSRRPSVLTPMAMMTATETIRPPRRTLR